MAAMSAKSTKAELVFIVQQTTWSLAFCLFLVPQVAVNMTSCQACQLTAQSKELLFSVVSLLTYRAFVKFFPIIMISPCIICQTGSESIAVSQMQQTADQSKSRVQGQTYLHVLISMYYYCYYYYHYQYFIIIIIKGFFKKLTVQQESWNHIARVQSKLNDNIHRFNRDSRGAKCR